MKLPVPFFNRNMCQSGGRLRPDPVFILGMHRSGTSALGGVLEALGLSVGKHVMLPQKENPKGFYENTSLSEFHDTFLASIGSTWRDPKPIGREQFQGGVALRFKEKLLRLLGEEFGANRPLIKDPRMCRLMPLWIALIQEHFPKAAFILPVRHPVEVAHSLQQRSKLPMEQGLALWVVHVLEAERATRGFPRLFSTYDELMQSPFETVLRLADGLGLSTDAVAAAVSGRLDVTLRHHEQLSWPAGAPREQLTLSIYRAFVSEKLAKPEILDGLRKEYYSEAGWNC